MKTGLKQGEKEGSWSCKRVAELSLNKKSLFVKLVTGECYGKDLLSVSRSWFSVGSLNSYSVC